MNLMLSRGCAAIVFRPAFDENVEALCRDIARALTKVFQGQRGASRATG